MCDSVSQTCRAPSDCSTVDATRPYSRGGGARSDLADTSASVLGRRQTRRREFAVPHPGIANSARPGRAPVSNWHPRVRVEQEAQNEMAVCRASNRDGVSLDQGPFERADEAVAEGSRGAGTLALSVEAAQSRLAEETMTSSTNRDATA